MSDFDRFDFEKNDIKNENTSENEAFEQKGIDIPFPQLDVRVKQ